jgi:hypothetical protein
VSERTNAQKKELAWLSRWKRGPKKRASIEDILDERTADKPVLRLQTILNEKKKAYLMEELALEESERDTLLQLGYTENELDTFEEVGDIMNAREMIIYSEQFTPEELDYVSKQAKGDKKSLRRALTRASAEGDVPTDAGLRTQYLQLMGQMVRRNVKLEKRQAKRLYKGKGDVNLLNPFSSIRYALGQMETIAGKPLRRLYGNMVSKANAAKAKTYKSVRDMYGRAGIKPSQFKLTYQENNDLAEWLYSGNKEAFNRLSSSTQKMGEQIRDTLSNEYAFKVRKIRWFLWTKLGKEPTMPKGMNAKEILEEGKNAEAEGRLDEWLATQSWGTRETYYMSEFDTENLTDSFMTSLMPPSLTATTPKEATPATVPSAVHTRRGEGKAKRGSVINNVANHMGKVDIALSVMEDVKQFWKNFQDADPTMEDSAVMREFVDNMMGRSRKHGVAKQFVKGARKWFWRLHFLNPFKGLWFAYRNLHQNLAYGLTAVSATETAKSVKDIIVEKATGQVNSQREDAFIETFVPKITQKRQMQREAMLQEESTIKGVDHNWFINAADVFGQMAVLSDEGNRMMIWPVLHRVAQRNLEQYRNGAITDKKLIKRLKLNTLHPSQQMEMLTLLDQGKDTEFMSNFAEYKTENLHFKYETALRAGIEQDPVTRALTGLMVYPRGVWEIFYQNGAKPAITGWKNKNYAQAYEGVKNMAGLIMMSAVTKWLIWQVAGKKAYGFFSTLFDYSPLGPELGKIIDLTDQITRTNYRANQEGWELGKTVDKMVGIAVNEMEFFIPATDFMVDLYESINDKEGVRLWSLIKEELLDSYETKTGAGWKKNDRTAYEKVMHVLLSGGFEKEIKATSLRKRRLPRR